MIIEPDWNDTSSFTADHASQILGRPRATLAGHIARYDALRIDPVVPGSTRRLSMNQLTALAFVRQLTGAGLSQASINGSLDELREYAGGLFNSVRGTALSQESEVRRFDATGVGSVVAVETQFAYDFEVKNFATFLAVGLVPELISIDAQPHLDGVYDAHSFPVPAVVIPVDRVLKVCWARALSIANGQPIAA